MKRSAASAASLSRGDSSSMSSSSGPALAAFRRLSSAAGDDPVPASRARVDLDAERVFGGDDGEGAAGGAFAGRRAPEEVPPRAFPFAGAGGGPEGAAGGPRATCDPKAPPSPAAAFSAVGAAWGGAGALDEAAAASPAGETACRAPPISRRGGRRAAGHCFAACPKREHPKHRRGLLSCPLYQTPKCSAPSAAGRDASSSRISTDGGKHRASSSGEGSTER
eukprot:tig00021127_g18765.t1